MWPVLEGIPPLFAAPPVNYWVTSAPAVRPFSVDIGGFRDVSSVRDAYDGDAVLCLHKEDDYLEPTQGVHSQVKLVLL